MSDGNVLGIGISGSRFTPPPARELDAAGVTLEGEFDVGVKAHADPASTAQKITTRTERVNGRLGTASPSGLRRGHV
jgi:hypothetical protein